MGPGHLWTAIRYVECNPVRAGLASEPAEFAWSSAEAHFSGQDRQRLLDMHFFEEAGGIAGWRRLFGEPESELTYSALRKATHSGQPFGDQAFQDGIRAIRATGSPATDTMAVRSCTSETLMAAG
jgi:putative transposase